jgi:hypothetical protein
MIIGGGGRSDPSRTHQSPATLATFPSWGVDRDDATRGVCCSLPLGWGGPQGHRRIRLVAYGARLESVLGESPRGFESPILREKWIETS